MKKDKAVGNIDDAVIVFKEGVGVIDIYTNSRDGMDYVWSEANTEDGPLHLYPLRSITKISGKEIEW